MNVEQSIESLVSIGITTKNRWQDLELTLNILIKCNLDRKVSILIYDDGSDQPCPFHWEKLPLNIQLKRFDESKGYIVRRNQLAEAIETKYYLSLDDDSFPVAGSLSEALTYAQSHENDLFCLAFPIYNPVLGKHQSRSLQSQPYQVRSFIGCGHLIHRSRFLELGGYREELTHQGEEMEIAARALQKGYRCYHFPNLQIHHTASNQGRNWYRMDYYGARNKILWNDWFIPPEQRTIKQCRTMLSFIILAARVRRWGPIEGIMAAFSSISKYNHCRYSMSKDIYQSWQTFPHS
ncbi:MAG: glycosyl transferase family 2 [Cyanobacteria bacterium QH_9_48_43]|nr:MAG: glycosyl transferase family 2 [Cyanobacteria bacterium QH_9_48_43]